MYRQTVGIRYVKLNIIIFVLIINILTLHIIIFINFGV